MKLAMIPQRMRFLGAVTYLSLLLFLCWTCLVGQQQSSGSPPFVVAPCWHIGAVGDKINAAHVLGQKECAECHKSELAAWQKSKHATLSYQMLTTNPKAKGFAQKLGIGAAEMTSSSVCTTCHGMQKETGGKITALMGNSCEACHGASGPKDKGWFAVHSNYGADVKDRSKETKEHHQKRVAACEKLGMRMSANPYQLAKNCYQCHTVPNEQLVNKAGHPPGNAGFEFLPWAQGEVRHNFQLDPKVNAEAPTIWMNPQFGEKRTAAQRRRLMYVLGQFADLEVSLRNRGNATGPGGFATTAAGRVAAANGKLTLINTMAPSPEVKAAMAETTKVFGMLFVPPAAGQKAKFMAAADKVKEAAEKFVATHDGSKLAALDVVIPKTAKGPVFKP